MACPPRISSSRDWPSRLSEAPPGVASAWGEESSAASTPWSSLPDQRSGFSLPSLSVTSSCRCFTRSAQPERPSMNIMHLINPNLTLNASTVVLLLQLAAVLHLGLLWAGLSMPRAVGLGGHLAPLPAFVRHLFYVYYGFIGLTLIAFGLFTYFFAAPMAHGEPVARGLCIFMTV